MDIRKKLLTAAALVVSVMLGVGAQAQPAMAGLSDLQLGCFVDTVELDPFTMGYCTPSRPQPSYTVVFKVFGNEGGNYRYRWGTLGTADPTNNCTTTSDQCWVKIRAPYYGTMRVTVTDLATGQSVSLSADVDVEPVCYFGGQWVWC